MNDCPTCKIPLVGSNGPLFCHKCGWVKHLVLNTRVHVIPVGDESLHAAQEICWCHPTEVEPGIFVHNAKDCREKIERVTGERCSEGWVNIAEYLDTNYE